MGWDGLGQRVVCWRGCVHIATGGNEEKPEPEHARMTVTNHVQSRYLMYLIETET